MILGRVSLLFYLSFISLIFWRPQKGKSSEFVKHKRYAVVRSGFCCPEFIPTTICLSRYLNGQSYNSMSWYCFSILQRLKKVHIPAAAVLHVDNASSSSA